MNEFNPYAPPKSMDYGPSALVEDPNAAWRDGKLLRVRKGAVLPDRCLKCNEPAEGFQFKRSLTWASPFYSILILSPLIYVIVYLIVCHRGKVTAGVCALHRRKRTRAILTGWLIALAGLGCVFSVVFVPPDYVGEALAAGIVVMVVGLLAGVFGSRIIIPRRIDKHFIWLGNVSPVYLATFPEQPI